MPQLFDFAVEDFVTQDEAIKSTSPFWKDFKGCWYRAVRAYRKIPEHVRGRLERAPSKRIANLNHLAKTYAMDRFGSDADSAKRPGIVPCTLIPSLLLLELDRRILLRFNALNNRHIVTIGRYASNTRRKYFNQDRISEYKLNNDATRLTIGPIFDEMGIEIKAIEISLQKGDLHLWHFAIDGAGAIPMPIPAAKSPAKPAELTSVIKINKPR